MLFAYTPLRTLHNIDKLQGYVDYIFYNVWCKSPEGIEFGIELFTGNNELSEIIMAFGYSAKAHKKGKLFFDRIKAIYTLFARLSQQQIEKLTRWYDANNNVEMACSDTSTSIAQYDDINTINPDLSRRLKEFYTGLWDSSFLGAAALRQKVGTIDEYYKDFMTVNNNGVCPFCGLSDMLGKYSSNREAYDHYLPKSKYPFNSLNFKNLFPACTICNSKSKTTKDPLYKGSARRKAFYPFAQDHAGIKISVSLNAADINQLANNDIEFSFGPASKQEEIDGWRELYKIDEHYKKKLIQMKYVFEDLRIAIENGHGTAEECYRSKLEECDRNPLQDRQFLKKAFLEACKEKGFGPILSQQAEK